MDLPELPPFRQDDLMDDSTIELFRQYLEEVMRTKKHPVLLSSWADN